jgi:hypothetical protein
MEYVDRLQLFRELVGGFLRSYPQLSYDWEKESDGHMWIGGESQVEIQHWGVTVFKDEDKGFGVYVGWDGVSDVWFCAG